MNLLKNSSFAEISQISYVDSRHLLKRSTTQFYPFPEKQVKLMGNHPRIQVCMLDTGEDNTLFYKTKRHRKAGWEIQETCIQLSLRFGVAQSLEHLLAVFSELWAQLVVTASLGVLHSDRSPHKPCSWSHHLHFCAV